MKKMKKATIVIIACLMAMMSNAATFTWSFAFCNSQSGVAPVNVTAYLYADDYYFPWVGEGSFNTGTWILTDHIFGEDYYPAGYPVTALSLLVEPVSETLSKLTISWTTDSALDTLTDSAMNQYWTIVFVDDATSNYFGVQFMDFDNPFRLGNQDQQWDWYSLYPTDPFLDVGQFQSVAEPSVALLALVGLAVFGLRRRKAR